MRWGMLDDDGGYFYCIIYSQGLANGCIRDEAVAKGTVIAVERCVRLLRQELPEQAAHRRSRLQSQMSDKKPCQQMACRSRRRWEQGRKNRQKSTNYRLQISRCIMKSSHSLSLGCWCGLAISLYTIRRLCDFIVLQEAVNCCITTQIELYLKVLNNLINLSYFPF